MKKALVIALAAGMAASAMAQSAANASRENGQAPLGKQFIIYKWYVGKVAHYSKAPPRGISNYTMLNEYGMEIQKTRPTDGNTIHIIRPSDAPAANPLGSAPNAAKENNDSAESAADGAISKAAFCDQQRRNLQTLQTKTTIYENQGNNMVPLSEAQKQEHIKSVQDMISATCSE